MVQFITLLTVWLLGATAFAHQTGASTFIANLHEDTGVVETLISFPGRDLAAEVGADRNHDGQVSQAELAPLYGDMSAYLDQHIQVLNNGHPCNPIEKKAGPIAQALDTYWYLTSFQCELPLTKVTLKNDVMLDSEGGYRHLGRIQVGDMVETTAFNREFPSFDVNVSQPQTPIGQVLIRYGIEGVEHILLGPDHVLFVLLLLLLASSLRRLLWVVSSFTLAHSITLGLAALGVFDLPATLIEPLIALSIIYVAIETIVTYRKHQPTPEPTRNFVRLLLITFAFGLMHGFGFSYVLRDNVGLPSHALIPALAAFNIGVEFGQLALLLPLFPIRQWLIDKPFERPVLMALAGLALLVSGFWLIQRAVM